MNKPLLDEDIHEELMFNPNNSLLRVPIIKAQVVAYSIEDG
jgi:hypothetical protein